MSIRHERAAVGITAAIVALWFVFIDEPGWAMGIMVAAIVYSHLIT